MYSKLLTAVALGAVMSTAALAQSSDANQPASANGEWQASKLIHMNVYNDNNEKIGDIKELMVDKSGKIELVAIGVGGFLSMGEHDVAVKFDQLKWIDQPVSNSTSSNSNNRPASTTGSNPATQPAATSKHNYPDHAVLNATKDQLKSMPQFDYTK
jgi:sporulation protein YlmC with PRC-barrel domain